MLCTFKLLPISESKPEDILGSFYQLCTTYYHFVCERSFLESTLDTLVTTKV